MGNSRIPTLVDTSPAHVVAWFQMMHERGILFCLDDDPASLVRIVDGGLMFTELEAHEVSAIVGRIFSALGNEAHAVAFHVLSSTFHTKQERLAMQAAYG